jgi:hypothetical protein
MEGKEFLLSLNGEPLGTSTGVNLEDLSRKSPNFDKWELIENENGVYVFRNVHGQAITLNNVAGLEALQVGDYVDIDYTLKA